MRAALNWFHPSCSPPTEKATPLLKGGELSSRRRVGSVSQVSLVPEACLVLRRCQRLLSPGLLPGLHCHTEGLTAHSLAASPSQDSLVPTNLFMY